MNIFALKDKTGRMIILSMERWKHILKHPEMSDKLEEIKECLINPDVVIESRTDKNVRIYYRYNKNIKEYLLVSVKYLNGKGFIITSFYTDKIK
ncbi:MAG TPA: PBECR2 nuclease fold domain-containing protein [Candidatus Nanoarchaeia archaeon]|nr:PBECR2 nuclease fold domain-containing protein [Candidatus Nanoarchaeia archaeon]